MILYFSATGNSKYVAERIARATGGRAASIPEHSPVIALGDNESLGIVTPTYFWGLPVIVTEYLTQLQIRNGEGHYIYGIATYGTTCGQTGTFLQRLLKEKGLHLNARYSVKMPDTWTPIFDLSDKERVAELNREAEPQIDEIIRHVQSRDNGDFMRAKAPMFAVKLWQENYERDRRTSHLHAEDNCVGCGLCARSCPVGAIEMQDKRPVWVKEKCAMCLRCLHHCPKFAIQYDNKTQRHGQYVHPGLEERA